MLETIKITVCALVIAPAVLLSAYCAVAAFASRIEDRKTDDLDIVTPRSDSLAGRTSDTRDFLRDLPKAA
ncbi:MAG: hypothetical protein Q7T82_12290 [Armatimonadota bacterium]|nr:hypothetical protein [Armatimonadota bacterium]